DHTARLADTLRAGASNDALLDGPDERRAVQLYREAMRNAAETAAQLEHTTVRHAVAKAAPPLESLDQLRRCSSDLRRLGPRHRRTTLDSIASGELSASTALADIDAVRLLDQR